MNYTDDWKRVRCFDWLNVNNKKILCLTDRNALCEVDEATRTACVIDKYPNQRVSDSNLSWSCVYTGEKAVFVPLCSDSIAVYDIKLKKMEFVDLSEICDSRMQIIDAIDAGGLFFNAFKWDKYIYMFGWTIPAILRYDEGENLLKKIDEWIKELKDNKEDTKYFFGNGYVQHDNIFYLPLCCGNYLFVFNADSMEWKLVEISSKSSGFWGIVEFEGAIWLSDFSGKSKVITRVNFNTLKGIDIEIPKEFGEILSLVVVNDVLCCCSEFGGGFYVLNNHNECIDKIKYPWGKKEGMLLTAKAVSGKLCIVEKRTGKWYLYDFCSENYAEIEYMIGDENYLQESWNDKEVQKEEKEIEMFDKSHNEPVLESTLGMNGFIRQLTRK